MSRQARYLVEKIKKEVQNSSVKKQIDKRLKEFRSFKNKKTEDWFSELCFCLMTANWKAKESIEIQRDLSKKGFLDWDIKKLADFLKEHGHRFWLQRAERIVSARKYLSIKDIIQKQKDPRKWLVSNVKGLGYKEASHFLRNVGYTNFAILDRHIINSLIDNSLIDDSFKIMTSKRYLKTERIFGKLAKELDMSQAELDLYMWYLKTGRVLK